MKRYFFARLLVASLLLGSFMTGCEKWIDPAINDDPDSPDNPGLAVILSGTEGQTAFLTYGFDVNGITSMWLRYVTGSDRQALLFYNYQITEADMVNVWNSFYRGVLKDLQVLVVRAQSEEEYSPHFAAAGMVLTAYNLGLIAQLWGDIPVREAFRGEANLEPAFDTQANVYQFIDSLLVTAIELFDEDAGFFELEGDLIYDNDVEKWKNAAAALRARFAIHLSQVDDNAYQRALDALAVTRMNSSDDDMLFPCGTTPTTNNPLYQFCQSRGDVKSNPYFLSGILEDNHGIDPRAESAFQPTTTEITEYDNPFGVRGAKDAPVPLITYTEQQFILAEASWGVGLFEDAKSYLKEAVAASFFELGTDTTGWFFGFETDIESLNTSSFGFYQEIMYQKYIAMFAQPEAFVDWRRSGVPKLTPVFGDIMPRRFPYSSEERLYNPNTPNVFSIFAHNWFDPEPEATIAK